MNIFTRICCGLLLLPAIASAQTRDRSQDWEAGFHVSDYSSLSLFGFGGASMQVSGDPGYGFSGAYNFTNRLAVGVDVDWRSPDYRATFVPDGPGPVRTIRAKMDVARVHFKGIYHFGDRRIQPFIEAGYGWTRIDSNIVERPEFTGCWYDPWWGYTCQTSYITYTETRPTYGGAVGIRWDSRSEISLRGSLGSLQIERGEGVDNSAVETAQFEVMWRF